MQWTRSWPLLDWRTTDSFYESNGISAQALAHEPGLLKEWAF